MTKVRQPFTVSALSKSHGFGIWSSSGWPFFRCFSFGGTSGWVWVGLCTIGINHTDCGWWLRYQRLLWCEDWSHQQAWACSGWQGMRRRYALFFHTSLTVLGLLWVFIELENWHHQFLSGFLLWWYSTFETATFCRQCCRPYWPAFPSTWWPYCSIFQ